MNPPTLAIAGGTGNLGSKIVRELLSQSVRNRFRELIVLVRAETSTTREFAASGATIRMYSETNLTSALDGVDVLINTVGPSGHHFKEQLLRALPHSSVRLYFPSEFGVNHYIHDFAHEEWDAKKKHFQLAEELLGHGDVHVCRVFAGLFLEDSIGPWFGFFTKQNRYEAVGSPNQVTSYTSMRDVGRALAVLATLPSSEIPDMVHLSGDTKSISEIAAIMEAADPLKESIEVTSVALESYKAKIIADPRSTPERYLRFLMGEGRIDHTEGAMGNDNALIENADGFEGWRSMKDLAAETSGKPWLVDWEG